MPKTPDTIVNPAPRPTPVAVAIDTIPQTTRETSPEEAAERDAIVAILDAGQGARLDGFDARTDAGNTARRLGRTLSNATPDGKALRTAITQPTAGGPWSLYLHWGEPRKGGRKAANA